MSKIPEIFSIHRSPRPVIASFIEIELGDEMLAIQLLEDRADLYQIMPVGEGEDEPPMIDSIELDADLRQKGFGGAVNLDVKAKKLCWI